MAIITGPRLDEMSEQLVDWYLKTRDELVSVMEQGYPYGTVPLSPQEQVERFTSMTSEDWQVMATRLAERYRGRPDAQERARADIQLYITRMAKLAYRR